MTSQVDIERYLDDWLGNVPMDPADRVVVSVAVHISRGLAWASRRALRRDAEPISMSRRTFLARNPPPVA